MKIIFESSLLSQNGTSVATFDYANYNQEILGNESIILTKSTNYLKELHPNLEHHSETFNLFTKKFDVHQYNNWSEAEKIISDTKCDMLYTLKSGIQDEIVSQNTKTSVHAVFRCLQPHGTKNAFISEWLSVNFLGGQIPYVPHIVKLPEIDENLRKSLNIPKDAIVIGRHGSKTSFNLPFVFDVINRIINERTDLYFLFLNTNSFCESFSETRINNHERIIFLSETFDVFEKTKFINTCDATIHARKNGESFGLAIAEFSIRNKPVITWSGKEHHKFYEHGHDFAHIHMLGNCAYYYDDYDQLYNILKNFEPQPNKNWDVYSQKFTPQKVMEKFKSVFLD